MASSSVSQESLDRDEYEYTARKSRIRNLRSRGPSHKGDSFDGDHNGVDGLGGTVEQTEGSPGLGAGSAGVAAVAAVAAADHDSPTRISRAKDRDKRSRPNHLHKGKTAKDKRKLREKRRSTGVVHLPSTEVSLFHNTIKWSSYSPNLWMLLSHAKRAIFSLLSNYCGLLHCHAM